MYNKRVMDEMKWSEWIATENDRKRRRKVDKFESKYSCVNRSEHLCQPLSPVCWRMWLTRCSFLVNDFEQKLQRCGLSPVCCLTWFSRCSLRVNVFEQKSQRWGVSPVCHIMWFVKCSFRVNDFPGKLIRWFYTHNFKFVGKMLEWLDQVNLY